MYKKAFTILEVLIVLIIISIIIMASRTLFTVPVKYVIESEQCTNYIQWRVTKFFNDAVTGKLRSNVNNTNLFGFQEEWYGILFNGVKTWQQQQILFMWLSWNTFQQWVVLNNTNIALWTGSNIQWCTSNAHTVYMSGGIVSGGVLYPYRVDVNKNLISINWRPPMAICWSTGSNIQCVSWTQRFTWLVEFMTCKWNNCMSFFRILFDTRSQSIKSNKCLSLPFDKPCQRRQTTEF